MRRGSLSAAVAKSLAAMQRELGSAQEVAQLLEVQPATLLRWERYGLPTRQSRLLSIAETLAAAVTAGEQAAGGARERAARIAAVAEGRYSRAVRRRAARALQGALDELEKRNRLCRIRKSPTVQLANEIPVTAGKLRRWLRSGEVPLSEMPAFSYWAEQRAADQIAMVQERAESAEHIESAKRPGYQLSGTGRRNRQKAETTANFSTSTERMNSELTSGWHWSWKVERWLTPELLVQLVDKAEGAQPPRAFWALDYWIVTALVAIRHRPGGELHYSQRFRQFGGRQSQKKQRVAVLVNLNAPISSGRMGPGPTVSVKRRAVAAFRRAMVEQICGVNLTFVQGLEVRNYKFRTERERATWRGAREWSRLQEEKKQQRDKLKRQARRKRERAAARAVAAGKATTPRKKARRKKGSR